MADRLQRQSVAGGKRGALAPMQHPCIHGTRLMRRFGVARAQTWRWPRQTGCVTRCSACCCKCRRGDPRQDPRGRAQSLKRPPSPVWPGERAALAWVSGAFSRRPHWARPKAAHPSSYRLTEVAATASTAHRTALLQAERALRYATGMAQARHPDSCAAKPRACASAASESRRSTSSLRKSSFACGCERRFSRPRAIACGTAPLTAP